MKNIEITVKYLLGFGSQPLNGVEKVSWVRKNVFPSHLVCDANRL